MSDEEGLNEEIGKNYKEMVPHSSMGMNPHFELVRVKTRPNCLSAMRKEGLEREIIEMVPPTGIEPVFQP